MLPYKLWLLQLVMERGERKYICAVGIFMLNLRQLCLVLLVQNQSGLQCISTNNMIGSSTHKINQYGSHTICMITYLLDLLQVQILFR